MTMGTIDAPAKINLGLEILNRRADGYHEIRSVLATISLRDTLSFSTGSAPHDELIVHDRPEFGPEPNLVTVALNALRDSGAPIPPQRILLTKRIPVAAGLGGASSDAAATLRFFAAYLHLPEPEIVRLGGSLGSDVPFFLGEPFALVRGRGELPTPLPSPGSLSWAITVTPDLRIPAKTATMYRAITSEWWSSGELVERYAATFSGAAMAPPPNVFANVLFSLFPDAARIRDGLAQLGFPFVAVSGAGPTLYTLCDSEEEALCLAELARMLLSSEAVHVSRLGYRSSRSNLQPGLELHR